MVEIIPKEAPPISKWLNVLFYVAFVLLILSIISLFVLDNYLEKAKEGLTSLEESLLGEETAENLNLEKEILSYEKRVKDFPQLVSRHLSSSKVYPLIEKACHPQVWFSQFSLDTETGEIFLSGQTQTFESLGQQLLLFEAEDLIRSSSLKKVSVDKEGKVIFELTLSFDKEVLK